MADHSAVPVYWERMAVCWQLAADHGLAISVLMRAAQRDIVDRQRFADRVEAGSAGARATAAILAGMPMIGVLLGQLVGAHPLRFLFGAGPGLDSGSRGGPDRPGGDVVGPHHRPGGAMTGAETAALLLSLALLLSTRAVQVRRRAGALRQTRPNLRRPGRPIDPLATASTLDVLAVCLSAGLAVWAAAAATAPAAPPALRSVLQRAADLLALGLTRIRPGPCRTVMLPRVMTPRVRR